MVESGKGPARRGRADRPLLSEAVEVPEAVSAPCPWQQADPLPSSGPGLLRAQIMQEQKNRHQTERRSWKVNLEALEG